MPRKMRSNLNIIFAGSGEFGLPTLQHLAQTHNVIQVISQPDRPAGRGKKLTPTPIGEFAERNQLPRIKTANIKNETLPESDLLIVIAFGQKIPPHIVNHPRLGSVNLHASRLPKYRGASPINSAILNGDPTTGNSVIRLAERMDAGAILAQSELKIGETETAGELHDRLSRDGPAIMDRVITALAAGSAIEQPQDDSQATLAPKLNRQATVINFDRTMKEVTNHIRGFYPWPGCRVRVLDETGNEHGRLTLVRAQAGMKGLGERRLPGGTIRSDGSLRVADGPIYILEVQPEGKRPMSLSDYRNGHPWDFGMRLESII
jgi:methionyl-tRNA formyltransferase